MVYVDVGRKRGARVTGLVEVIKTPVVLNFKTNSGELMKIEMLKSIEIVGKLESIGHDPMHEEFYQTKWSPVAEQIKWLKAMKEAYSGRIPQEVTDGFNTRIKELEEAQE